MPRHDFWVRLWTCIWKRLVFGSGDWVKGPSSAVWAGISQLGAWREQTVEVGRFSLLELGQPAPPALECWSSWFSGLQTLGLLWDLHQRSLPSLCTQTEYSQAFLVLQLVHSRWWDFSASTTAEGSSCNKSLHVSVLLALFLWRTNYMGISDSSMLFFKNPSSTVVSLVCVLFTVYESSQSPLLHPLLLLSRVSFLFPVSIAFAVVSHTFVINFFSSVVFLLNVCAHFLAIPLLFLTCEKSPHTSRTGSKFASHHRGLPLLFSPCSSTSDSEKTAIVVNKLA